MFSFGFVAATIPLVITQIQSVKVGAGRNNKKLYKAYLIKKTKSQTVAFRNARKAAIF